jgi:hypothetical protein
LQPGIAFIFLPPIDKNNIVKQYLLNIFTIEFSVQELTYPGQIYNLVDDYCFANE